MMTPALLRDETAYMKAGTCPTGFSLNLHVHMHLLLKGNTRKLVRHVQF